MIGDQDVLILQEENGPSGSFGQAKTATRFTIMTYLTKYLTKGNTSAVLPLKEVAEFHSLAIEELQDGARAVTAVVVGAVAFFLKRHKINKRLSAVGVAVVKGKLEGLLANFNGRIDDLHTRYAGVEERLQQQQEFRAAQESQARAARRRHRILLLADSMFSLAKVTQEVYPISHSGETAEQLYNAIDLPLKIPARAVVVNHGLNHTRSFGDESMVRGGGGDGHCVGKDSAGSSGCAGVTPPNPRHPIIENP
jgi:hypothetical protein